MTSLNDPRREFRIGLPPAPEGVVRDPRVGAGRPKRHPRVPDPAENLGFDLRREYGRATLRIWDPLRARV